MLYSHRSTLLHAYGVNMPDAFGLRAADRIMPVVPMFHVNAWGTPYAAPLAGAGLVMPGRYLDGASMSAGVPTVWLGLLEHLRAAGGTLPTLTRLVCGGSACPPAIIDGMREYGVRVDHAWGEPVDPQKVEAALWARGAKLLAFVHAETSTGVRSSAVSPVPVARRRVG